MKLTDLEMENKIIFKFTYNEKPYSMNLDIIGKNSTHIVVPAILESGLLLSPDKLTATEIMFTTKDGIYHFTSMNIEASVLQDGVRVYYINSEEEVTRTNRREAFRVFIGDIVTIKAITPEGAKKEYEGILKNVSVKGMGVILKNDLAIGTTLSIIYNFEGLDFHLLGTIIRKEDHDRYKAYSYGCVFIGGNNGVNRIIMLKQMRDKKENKGS